MMVPFSYKPWMVYPSIALAIASGLCNIVPRLFSESFLVTNISTPSDHSTTALLDRYNRILSMFSTNHLMHFKLIKERLTRTFNVELAKDLIRKEQSLNQPVDSLMENLHLLVFQQLLVAMLFPPYVFTHSLVIYSVLNREQYLSELRVNYGLEPSKSQLQNGIHLLSMLQDHLMHTSFAQLTTLVDTLKIKFAFVAIYCLENLLVWRKSLPHLKVSVPCWNAFGKNTNFPHCH